MYCYGRQSRFPILPYRSVISWEHMQLSQDGSAITALRRKRRKHPTMIRAVGGVEEIVPGLSTWTAEDLLEAGAWDEELAEIARIDDEVYALDEEDRYDE